MLINKLIGTRLTVKENEGAPPDPTLTAVTRDIGTYKMYYAGQSHGYIGVISRFSYVQSPDKTEVEGLLTYLDGASRKIISTREQFPDYSVVDADEKIELSHFLAGVEYLANKHKELIPDLPAFLQANPVEAVKPSSERKVTTDEQWAPLTLLHYVPGKMAFVTALETGNVTDQLSNERHEKNNKIKIRNVYGKQVFATEETLERLALRWVPSLQTYVSVIDAEYVIRKIADKYILQQEVDEHPSRFFSCQKTGNLGFVADKIVMHDGTIICKEFFDRECFKCRECGKVFLTSEHHGHNGVCTACYKPRMGEVLREYSTDAYRELGAYNKRGELVKRIPEKQGQYLGIEAEILCSGSSKKGGSVIIQLRNGKLAEACRDGTVAGMELKTPPLHRDYAKSHIRKVFDIVEDVGQGDLSTDTSCGVHIHVSRNSVSELQISRLTSFMYNYQNSSFLEAIAGRKKNGQYYRFDEDKKSSAAVKRGGKKKVQFISDKYRAINLGKEHTIEFRLFQGTHKFENMAVYVDFVLAILDFTKAGVYTKKPNEAVHYSEFIAWLFDRKLPNRKLYPDLCSFLLSKTKLAAMYELKKKA